MREFQFNLFDFSRFRSELMGSATLLIILCHATKYDLGMPSWLFTILGNGGAGVDIFLFLSGLGIFNSYTNSENNGIPVYKWFWRRYVRIIIPCAFFIIPLTVLEYTQSSLGEIDFCGILLNLSGFGFLFGKGALWFVTCILFLYFITPMINKLLKGKNKYLYASILSFISLLLGYVYFSDNIMAYKLQFMLCRFPSYFIGYAIAKEIRDQHHVAIWKLVLVPFLGYILFFMLNRCLNAHFSLFWLQGIFLTSVIALLLKNTIVTKVLPLLRLLGSMSLESYATNILIMPLFFVKDFELWVMAPNIGKWCSYVVGTLICLAMSYVVNKLSKNIIKRIA